MSSSLDNPMELADGNQTSSNLPGPSTDGRSSDTDCGGHKTYMEDQPELSWYKHSTPYSTPTSSPKKPTRTHGDAKGESKVKQWLKAKKVQFTLPARKQKSTGFQRYVSENDIDARADLPIPDGANFEEARRCLQTTAPRGLVLQRLEVLREKPSLRSWRATYMWRSSIFPDPRDFNIVQARAIFQHNSPPNASVGKVVTTIQEGHSEALWSQVLYVRRDTHNAVHRVVHKMVSTVLPSIAIEPVARPDLQQVLSDRNNIHIRCRNGDGQTATFLLHDLIPHHTTPQKTFYNGFDVTRLIFAKTRICYLDLHKLRSGLTAVELRPQKSGNIRRWQIPYIDAVARYVTKWRRTSQATMQNVHQLDTSLTGTSITIDNYPSMELENICSDAIVVAKLATSPAVLSTLREQLACDIGSVCPAHCTRRLEVRDFEVRSTSYERAASLKRVGLECGDTHRIWNIYLSYVGFDHSTSCYPVASSIMTLLRRRERAENVDLVV